MPKAKVERVLSDDGTNKTVEVEVGERGKTKVARYVIPSNPKVFQEMILGLSDTPDEGKFEKGLLGEDREWQGASPLTYAYQLFITSVDKTARSMVYESLAQESTEVTIGKEKIDLMSIPLTRLVRSINRAREEYADAIENLKTTVLWKDKPAEDIAKAAGKNVGIGPWNTAARKLVEGYTNDDGHAVAPQAKEVDGKLVLLAA